MAPDIKFTSWGIPYLVEFTNVTFRSRKKRNSLAPPPVPPKFSHHVKARQSLYCNLDNSSDWSLASTSSEAETDEYEDAREEPELEETSQGLYIRFASRDYPVPLSESRLTRLKFRIANAVVAAGMDCSPGSEKSNPMETKLVGNRGSLPPVTMSSLYRGTYGQVMSALTDAGLTAAPCSESGLEHATRLGALFVLNDTGKGGLEFTKLTLWA